MLVSKIAALLLLLFIGILLVIAVGIPEIGSINYFEMATDTGGIIAAGALIFFAYIGFDEIVQMAEESKQPEKTQNSGIINKINIIVFLHIQIHFTYFILILYKICCTSLNDNKKNNYIKIQKIYHNKIWSFVFLYNSL